MLCTEELFDHPRPLIGMIHLDALPGTPAHRGDLDAIVERAAAEAAIYHDTGFHGLLIENMHDRPYLRGDVGPEIVAAMTAAGREIRRRVPLPLGVQVLAGANRAAMAVALGCGAAFVRVEAYVFAHVADEGLLEASAGELLRYRKAIGADSVRVFADIKKKHSAHAITADVDLVETGRAASFFLADSVIVSGTATGSPTDPAQVEAVAEALDIPVLVGSGVTAENLSSFIDAAGVIVGSYVKRDGVWSGPVDRERCAAVVTAFAAHGRK